MIQKLSGVCALTVALLAPSNAIAQGEPLRPESTNNGTNPIDSILQGVGTAITNIVSSRGSELETLMDEGKWAKADTYFHENEKYFLDGTSENEKILTKLAYGVNALFNSRLQSTRDTLVPFLQKRDSSNWGAIGVSLQSAKTVLETYQAYFVGRIDRFQSEKCRSLQSAVDQLIEQLKSSANSEFQKFNHFGNTSFFSAYPIPLDETDFLHSNRQWILATLDSAPASNISTFAKNYPKIGARLHESIAALFLKRAAQEQNDANRDFYATYTFMQHMRGSILGKDARYDDILLADATDTGQQHPSATVEASGLGLPMAKISPANLDTNSEAQKATYVVAYRSASNEPKRKVTDKSEMTSKYISGHRTLPNPAYQQAQANYVNAEQELNRQNLQNSLTPAYGWAALLRGAAQGIQAGVKQKYFQELQSTPATIDEPIYAEYSFRVTTVESTKSGSLDFAVLDRKRQTIAKFSSPWEEKKTFEVAYGIRRDDSAKYALDSRYVDEKAIDSFEQSPHSIALRESIERLVAAAPAFSTFAEGSDLFDRSTESAQSVAGTSGPEFNVKAAALATSTSVAAQENDSMNLAAELDSVVIVRNPTGLLGAGFYVAPDLVLTNQHVVEGSKFAEIKLHNGTDSVGRVLKTDIGLDLALIKVADKGRPVTFQNLPFSAGVTVEAIGHPKGLTFSITRGIVSAIRKMKNPLVPGSRQMLVIQTDAAINPGNSGGPLFLNGKVIGVNSQKLSASGIEGIGFAIHFVEISRFLNE